MAKTKNKQSARERRILIAALLVAGVMIGGSTFAWFTSKDEVTNRLSASAAYDVSIAEDFQPPADWVPGQVINKDVSAVNTGSVDAFVRMWLEGELKVMKQLPAASSKPVPANFAAGLGFTAVDASDPMYALGYRYLEGEGEEKKYFKVLGTTERANPNINGTNAAVDDNDYSEIKSVQAGGYLVSAPEGAVWSYVAEQQTEIINSDGEKQQVAQGTTIYSKSGAGGERVAVNVDADCAIDSDTFKPETHGLYIFRRNVTLSGTSSYEYSGYVFDGENYFALYNDMEGNSDYTLPADVVNANGTIDTSKIKLSTVTETVVLNAGLKWTYNAEGSKLAATYAAGEGTDDDIVIDIALANIKSAEHKGQTWTAITGENKITTFYYNDDLEAGASSAKLIDSVELSRNTKKQAYVAFDFDLNVHLQSVQVAKDESGQELTTPVEQNGEFASAPADKNIATAKAAEQTAEEIADIAWTAS